MSEFDPKILAEKSGNTFHYKVVKYLRDNGWSVLVSPYYPDNATDVSREIDIIAERSQTIEVEAESFGSSKNEIINIRLYIECKYINANTVFWFDNKDAQNAWKLAQSQIGFQEDSPIYKKHHYITKKRVAKLFETDKSSRLDQEPIYKAINQVLSSMAYY